jgi:hypothetical protein
MQSTGTAWLGTTLSRHWQRRPLPNLVPDFTRHNHGRLHHLKTLAHLLPNVELKEGGPVLPDDSTWEIVHPLELRIGPQRSDGIPNQSSLGSKLKSTDNHNVQKSWMEG